LYTIIFLIRILFKLFLLLKKLFFVNFQKPGNTESHLHLLLLLSGEGSAVGVAAGGKSWKQQQQMKRMPMHKEQHKCERERWPAS